MAHGTAPERWDRLLDPPSEVRVTITVAPRSPRVEHLLRALCIKGPRARRVTWCVAALAATAALAGAAVGELDRSVKATRQVRPAEWGVLRRCGGLSLPAGLLGRDADECLATPRAAHIAGRSGPCWHYGVYVTAVLRRDHGVWHLMLAARSDSCPSVRLPAEIRALLGICGKAVIRSAVHDRRSSVYARRKH